MEYYEYYDETEIENMKREINDDPLIPRTTKVMLIEYNIRPLESQGSIQFATTAKECKDGSPQDEELMFNGICSPEVCLMGYDIEREDPITNVRVLYDRAVVRTNKPKEYWVNRLK